MKTSSLVCAVVVTIALLAASLFVQSCFGPRVKPAAVFPPAALAWPAVDEDVQRGIADAVEDGDLTQDAANALNTQALRIGTALTERDLETIRVAPWSSLEPWAERGIADKVDDGEIGPGVALSLREQLAKFTEAILILKGTI